MSKKKWGRVAWEAACSFVAEDDGLPVVETGGMWTAHKLYFLCSYLAQVLEGIHGNTAFPDGLTFIDCFAGTGVCAVRDDDGRIHRYPGSSLIAASLKPHGKSFTRVYSIESRKQHLDALRTRLGRVGFTGELRSWSGDFNNTAREVAAAVPPRSLNVAFVDPYSLDAHYDAIESLARARSLDLVILFSDRIDLQRNVELNYYPRRDSKLDEFLGSQSNWRADYDRLQDRSGVRLREMFAKIYLAQLKRLGYLHGDSWPLEGPQGPMFRLVFASKNQLGFKYCEIARREDFGGEQSLFS